MRERSEGHTEREAFLERTTVAGGCEEGEGTGDGGEGAGGEAQRKGGGGGGGEEGRREAAGTGS